MSTNYSRTSTQIITRALRILGEIGLGQTASSDAVTEGLEALNVILKRVSTKGTILTQATWAQVNPSTTLSEVIGTDGLNYQCMLGHTATSASQPVGTLSTATWSLYWERGGTAGSAWALSTAYTSPRTFTLNGDWDTIDKAVWQKDGVEYPLQLISLQEYLDTDQKLFQAAIPQQMAIEYSTTGIRAYLYPVPNSFDSAALKVLAIKLFLDEDGSATPELSAVWLDYLTYALAANLADEYSLPLQERAYLANKAEEMLKECLSSNTTFDSPRYVRGAF